MRLALIIARRSLLARPGRTAFAILGIALGIATVVAIFTLDHNTILGLSQPNRPGWKADVEVSPSIKVEDPKTDLLQRPGVEKVGAYFQSDVLLRPGAGQAGSDQKPQRVRLFGVDARIDTFPMYQVVQGRDLGGFGSEAREVLVATPLAEALGLSPGDEVDLARPPRAAKRACVDGEMKVVRPEEPLPPRIVSFKIVGIIAKQGLGYRSRGAVVVTEYKPGRQLFSDVAVSERFVIRKDPDASVEELQASLAEAYSYELSRSVIVGQAADERAFRNGVRFAGLLAMVLGLFVIFHTLSIALLERMREIATLSALGATRRQIGVVFLFEATILAGLGGGCGLGLGALLAKLLLKLEITTLGVGKRVDVFEIPWDNVLPLVFVGMLIALLGAVYPLLRMRKMKTGVVLRGDHEPRTDAASRGFRTFAAVLLAIVMPALYFTVAPVLGETSVSLGGVLLLGAGLLMLLVFLPLIVPQLLARVVALFARPFERRWPLAGALAARTMVERPTRVSVAAVGIAMVTAAFVTLEGMTASLRAELEVWAEEAVDQKIFVSEIGDLDFDELAPVLRDHPDVIGVERGDSRHYAPFLVIGLPIDQLMNYGPCSEDVEIGDALRDGSGMIVSGRLARDLSLIVGDRLQMDAPGGKKIEHEIVAVSDTYGYFPWPDERMYAIVSDEGLRRDFCIDASSTNRVALRLRDGADPQRLRGELRERYAALLPAAADWGFETGIARRDFGVNDINRDFLLFDLIIGLSASLASLGVLNGLLLSALERGKELGILRALGTDRKQVAGMVFLETLLVGVVGAVIGLLIGLGITPVITAALEDMSGLELPYRSGGSILVIGMLVAVFVTLLSALYPIWRMNRMPAVKAIRGG